MKSGMQDEANEMLSDEEEGENDMDTNTWHSTGTSMPSVV